MNFPLKVPAIKVSQPLGVFYSVALPASVLLEVSYSIRAELLENDTDDGFFMGGLRRIKGGQRDRKTSRLEEIRKYSEEVDASFPNSIILGANYGDDGTLIEDEEDKQIRWSVINENGCLYLLIPSNEKVASIIDGQHRVYGFMNSNVKNTELVCSVYLDLPLPYHAQIFTKINMNQKRVDKNLAYQLFQFDMEQGDVKNWSPETLAVYIARVLSEKIGSPLYKKMRLGIANTDNSSTISMASVIDGILTLISSNPKEDRSLLHQVSLPKRSRDLLGSRSDRSPLRSLYIKGQDKTLFKIIESFFQVVEVELWNERNKIFQKTLGVQALFDFLKVLAKERVDNLDRESFEKVFVDISSFDFSQDYFGVQTKVRARVKNVMLVLSKMRTIEEIVDEKDHDLFCKIIENGARLPKS